MPNRFYIDQYVQVGSYSPTGWQRIPGRITAIYLDEMDDIRYNVHTQPEPGKVETMKGIREFQLSADLDNESEEISPDCVQMMISFLNAIIPRNHSDGFRYCRARKEHVDIFDHPISPNQEYIVRQLGFRGENNIKISSKSLMSLWNILTLWGAERKNIYEMVITLKDVLPFHDLCTLAETIRAIESYENPQQQQNNPEGK
jgi:hypothetical protein